MPTKAELQDRIARLEMLSRIGRELNAAHTEEELLDIVVQSVRGAEAFWATLMYVDFNEVEEPTWIEIAASWERGVEPAVPAGMRYHLPEFYLSSLCWDGSLETKLVADVSTDDRVSSEARRVLARMGIRAIVVIPLVQAGCWVGLLTLGWPEVHTFSQQEAEIYTALVDIVSPVVGGYRLTKAAHIHTGELSVLNELGQALTMRLSVEEVVAETYRQTSRLLDTTSFYIALYDQETNIVSFPLAFERGEQVEWPPRQAGDGLTEYIIRHRRPLLFQEDILGQLEDLDVEMIGEEAFSWVGVPLMIGDRVLGVMALQDLTTSHAYGEHERDLLAAIAGQVTIALQNAQLFEETQRRMREVQLLHDVSLAAASGLRLEETLQAAADALANEYEDTLVGFMLLEPENDSLYMAVGVGYPQELIRQKHMPAGEGIVGWAIRHNEPVLVPDVSQDPRFISFDEVDVETRSELCVPLFTGTCVLGALNVESPGLNAFTVDDQRLLSTLAGNLAVLIERAQLFENMEQMVEERTDELRKSVEEHERLREELIEAQTQTLQELMTPVIPIMERIIVMPLIGSIDTMRARDIMRALLAGIGEHRAEVVILDVTGVPVVDSGVANHLNKTVQAARLKGARTIVTGISDAVAETIVDLGIDWSGIETLSDLQTGLIVALEGLGIKMVGYAP